MKMSQLFGVFLLFVLLQGCGWASVEVGEVDPTSITSVGSSKSPLGQGGNQQHKGTNLGFYGGVDGHLRSVKGSKISGKIALQRASN